MDHVRSPRLAGLISALSLIVPVGATMAWLQRWDPVVLAFATLLSVPCYFLARNRILLEREHPGWRRRD
jgi:hypothetical protein